MPDPMKYKKLIQCGNEQLSWRVGTLHRYILFRKLVRAQLMSCYA